MKNKVKIVLVALFSLSAWGIAPDEEFVVIVNPGNTVASMTASQVKLTYMRKITKRWKEINKNIVPVDHKNNSEVRKKILSAILDLSSDDLSRYFTEKEYQNADAPPVKLSNDQEVIDFVANNIGAIGFVKKSSVKSESVKIVLSF